MAALTADRNTPRIEGVYFRYPVAASVVVYKGALVMLDAAGNATPGAAATGQIAAGLAIQHADNAAGSPGAVHVTVEKGVFRFANSAAADEIFQADVGGDCFIVDDQTVAKTNGSSSRSVAGKIMAVDSLGVWVRID
jgi:hypothetical protein